MVGRAILPKDQAGVVLTLLQGFPDWFKPAHRAFLGEAPHPERKTIPAVS
jgi:hypothetical protein